MVYVQTKNPSFENEAHKIHIDFEIQINHLILDRRLNLEIIREKGKNKKRKKERNENMPPCFFCSPSWSLIENIKKART